jgi:amino-acid N-acetyltransferase
MMVCLRPATSADAPAIQALVRAERLNPNGLDWPNFTVAVDEDGAIVGAVQLRRHADGSRELGSFVVARDARGRGIGGRLIDVLLKHTHNPLNNPLSNPLNTPVHMITASVHAGHYRRWGFRPIEPQQAPRAVRFNYRMGRLARVLSFLRGEPARDLVILERSSSSAAHEPADPAVRVRRRAGVVA